MMTPRTEEPDDEFDPLPQSYELASTEVNKLIEAVRGLRSAIQDQQKMLAAMDNVVVEINEELRQTRVRRRKIQEES